MKYHRVQIDAKPHKEHISHRSHSIRLIRDCPENVFIDIRTTYKILLLGLG